MNGGYFMIDCNGLDLIKGQTPQEVPGLYAEMQKAQKSGKPIFCYNAVWSTQGVITPIQVFIVDFSSDNYMIATASTLQVVVTSSDVVTINNMAPAN